MVTKIQSRTLVFKTNADPVKDAHTVSGALIQGVSCWNLEKRRGSTHLYVKCNIECEKIIARMEKMGFTCELFYGE